MAYCLCNENKDWIWEQYGKDCPFENELMDLFLKEHCFLCGIALSSNIVAVTHYFGKLHKKEIKKWYSEKYGVDILVPFEPELQTEKMIPVLCNENKDWIWEQYGEDCTFEDDLMHLFLKEHCVLCDIALSSSTVAVAHYFGKLHKKEIKKWYSEKYGVDFLVPFEPKLQTEKMAPDFCNENKDWIWEQYGKDCPYENDLMDLFLKEHCYLCDITLSSSTVAVAHYFGKLHKKEIKKWYCEKYGVDILAPFEPKLQTEKMAPYFCNENKDWIWEQYGKDCPYENDLMDLFLKEHCYLCDIALSSSTVAVAHYFGKLHKKEIKKWYCEKYGVDILAPFEPKLQTEKMAPDYCNENKDWIWEQYGKDCPFENYLMDLFLKEHCYLCDIALSSSTVAVAHYFGKHHKKEIKKWYSEKYGVDFLVPFEPKLQTEKMAPDFCNENKDWIWEQYGEDCPFEHDLMDLFLKERCDLCNIALSSNTVAMAHYFGKVHKREIKKWYSEKYGEDFLVPFVPKLQIKEEYGMEMCLVCHISFKSHVEMMQHFEGKKHFKKIKLSF